MELKDLLDLIGIDADDKTTLDDVKAKFHETWASVKLVPTDERFTKPIVGKALGSITTALQRSFKSTGIELSDEELKDKRVEEIIDLGFGKVGGKIKELDEKSKAGNDTKLKKAEEELENWKKKYEERDTLYQTVKGEFETKEKEWDGKYKSFKLNQKVADAESKLNYSDQADEYRRLGFKTKLSEKYRLELDDQDNIAVYDAKTNQRVITDNKKEEAKWEDILTKEADLAGLLKKNDANKNSGGYSRPIPTGQNNRNNNGGGKEEFVNFIHPDALAG